MFYDIVDDNWNNPERGNLDKHGRDILNNSERDNSNNHERDNLGLFRPIDEGQGYKKMNKLYLK